MEVAADVVDRHEGGRVAAKWLLAKLRRAERNPERGVDGVFVAPVRKRLEGCDVGLGAGRAQKLGAEPAARGDDELDRHALDGHPGRAVVAPLEHGDDLGETLELVE